MGIKFEALNGVGIKIHSILDCFRDRFRLGTFTISDLRSRGNDFSLTVERFSITEVFRLEILRSLQISLQTKSSGIVTF